MKIRALSLCLNASAFALLPAVAAAESAASPDAELASLRAELQAMKETVGALKAELGALKADKTVGPAPVTVQPSQRAPSAPLPATETVVKWGGFIKANASMTRYNDGELATGSLARDFYFPSATPVGGEASTVSQLIAKQTRLWLNVASPVADHTVKGYVEVDFQTTPGTGNQRATNGYNLAVRRAYIQYDNWLVGQNWSNFLHVGAMPESTDFAGPSDGVVFIRQPQIAYTFRLAPKVSLTLAAENPETLSMPMATGVVSDNDDDPLPDFTAHMVYTGGFGELSLATLTRRLELRTNGHSETATGWGVSAAGRLPFGAKKANDIRFMLTTGEGMGRYLGLNFAPDVIYGVSASDRFETVPVTGGYVATKFALSKSWRTTLMYSRIEADYPSGVASAVSRSSQSFAANLFVTPVKGVDAGVEYRYGQRETVGGQKGDFNRIELALRLGF